MPTITPLPTPPSRQDPTNFSARADAFLAALVLFQQELNAVLPAESAAGLAVSLASTGDAGQGAGLVQWLRTLGYAAGTVGHKLAQTLSVLDAPYSADPSGVADSATAFADAKATGKLVHRPKGIYKRGATTTTYASDGMEGTLWIGDRAVSYSDDAVVVVARNVDNTGSGNGHAFTDSSVLNRSGTVSYNSFDARIRVEGAYDFGHYAAFQVGPTLAGSGTMGDLFSFIASPAVESGTLTNCHGLLVNPPTVTGSGAVTNCYGMYAPGTFGEAYNPATGDIYFFKNDSDAPSYSGGRVQAAGGILAGTADTGYVRVQTADLVSAAAATVGLRMQQISWQTWDITNPASQTYLRFASASGEQLRILNTGGIQAGADNASALGSGAVRWSTVYAATGSINTSDERAKQDIGGIPVEWLQAWADVQWQRFRFKDAAEAKGDGARWHVGLVAQRVRDVFAAHGLDALALGLLCHDTWADEWEDVPEERRGTSVLDADGKPITIIVRPASRVLVRSAGDRWGIRYEEALAMECAFLRWTTEGKQS